ncbi:MAG TPA: LPS export ABC transporter periplasmic protein LptC [Syntrophales bacterium]|nr:LPS export ABC transporter periplasmic protein LptC [Syntrophales bacterium]HON23422.1 LPS export ABC transporter periplasmic protein LptC [Syntrophales bacterium]HOU77001.1 LPS export ABC transporter periplasmic protein LptC [Syntrophales bacterium]HPC32281.1 LPS export ABC transporter periplasmic protein LptC [Syntrophales bacterium]HQG34023.1 LPS export ABC transporter periplasmic protein LptC [Syntrophales bacterium]
MRNISRKLKKPLPVITAVLILIAAAVLFYLWERGKEEAQKVLKILPDHVDMQLRDVHYTDVSADGAKWDIRANTVTYGRRENLAVFDQVTVEMTMADGRTYRLTGKEGFYWTATKDMEVRGNVVIISDQGDRITTDKLFYTEKNKTLHTDAPVILDNEKTRIHGQGMRLSMNDRRLELMSHVKAIIKTGKM